MSSSGRYYKYGFNGNACEAEEGYTSHIANDNEYHGKYGFKENFEVSQCRPDTLQQDLADIFWFFSL